ncbi:MAG: META domain-containing protein [Methanomassiliicoccales archaeon]|jgi:heat shock protein HslJ|nr:META domain-containing protein [Methanomassiliicoccales archaeon]
MEETSWIDPSLGPFKRWLLATYRDSNGIMSTAIPGKKADLMFFAEGRIAGSGGCNRLMASCNVVGNRMKIGPVASTLMFCSDPPEIMDQEADYFKCLNAAASYEVKDDVLLIYDEEARLLLKFDLDPDYP